MEKIWLKNYPKGVPHTINPDAYASVVAVFNECCEKYSQRPAYANMGTVLTYKQLDELTNNFAAYLQNDLGLDKGDRVAIMMPNLLQYPIALFGAMRAGCTIVNTNPLYTKREVVHQFNDAGVSAVVVLANFASVVQEAMPQLNSVKKVIVTQIGDLFSPVKRTLVNFVVKRIKKMVPKWSIDGHICFNKTLKIGASKRKQFTPVELTGEDIAFLQYTGGTTGVPKGAVLTHRNMVANIEQANAWISPFTEPGKEIIITALPLYHIFSLTANCMTFMKLGALNVLITNPRDIPGFVKELSNYKFTAFTGVNTLFNALLNNKGFLKLDFTSLRLTLGGGMAVQQAVAQRWHEVTGHPLLEAYGLTETSPAVTINPLDLPEYNGTIGIPVPSTEVTIRDDEGHVLPVGEPGELYVRGPQVMREYWNKPIETKNVFLRDDWLDTGDIASIDEEGFLRILERKKDMILVSGFNVYPNEVEDIIASHPGVLEVAVIGVPHHISGEVVKAFVVKKDPELTDVQVREFCREKLTAYKVPKQVEFRDELPKTNVGKILRRELREEVN